MDKRLEPRAVFEKLQDFLAWCELAPPGTLLLASEVAELLSDTPLDHQEGHGTPDPLPIETPSTWRERLWIVPAETRLGVVEVAEALGRSRSFVYARTAVTAKNRLPHRKLNGFLVFTAGELRTWIRETEKEVVGLPMESTSFERESGMEGLAV